LDLGESKRGNMSEPLSIKIFLAKGSSSSLRTAEISNWSGKAIACSRKELEELSKRDEASRPGVYFLIGNDSETGEDSAYVGEAEQVTKRLKQHLNKDYWNQVVAFVSKDENLTKAHIKYLEGKLIDLGLQASKGIIHNNQSSGARLPEADQAEMDIFLDRILKLLPIMGTSLFNLPSVPDLDDQNAKAKLICKIKGLVAFGNRTENGFVVYKGSQSVLEDRPAAIQKKGTHFQRRKKLLAKGILEKVEGALVFTLDYEFTSPSLAAAAVCGGSANGLTKWKSDSGESLKEIEAKG
jgi:hypothetical protein